MGPRTRMLDDSHAIVVRHTVAPGTRFIDLWLIPIRRWWSTPVWVRLLPLLVYWPVPVFGLSTIVAWERLMTAVGHRLWFGAPDSGAVPASLLIVNVLLFIVTPAVIVILGLLHAPIMIVAVIVTRAIQRRSDAHDRAKGVCIACQYEFGRLPPTTHATRGTWVICPECGAAWDPGPPDHLERTSQPRASYRTLAKVGLGSSYFKQLTLGEKVTVAMPLAVALLLIATLAAHGYVLKRSDILEWIMKYQKGGYWTVMFLPSLLPLGYLLVCTILTGTQ